MRYLFVYGTLKEGYCNDMLLRGTEFTGEAVTTDSFNIKSFGVPIVLAPMNAEMEDLAKPIVGEVYNILPKVLRTVDILEGHPDLYKRIKTKVKLFETYETLEAYIYLFQPDDICIYDYGLTDNDNSVTVTEHGYEWIDVIPCWLCGENIKVKGSNGRCPNCGTFVRF